MTLRLHDYGIATAYMRAAIGAGTTELLQCSEAVRGLRARSVRGQALSEPEGMFLVGQSDLAVMIETRDFRTILELRYPALDSRVTAVSWVFSIPYDSGGPDRPSGPGLRFMLHVRLDRAVYAYTGIEEKIIEKLLELLGAHSNAVRIHAGLGWSDLLVDGVFRAPEDLFEFILNAGAIQIRAGNVTVPAIRDMVTVIGYSGDSPPVPNVSHLTFFRAAPGHIEDVTNQLRRYGEPFAFVDGKADFMLKSVSGITGWLESDRALADAARHGVLEKLETHLLTVNQSSVRARAEPRRVVIHAGDRVLHRRCDCESSHADAVQGIARSLGSFDDRLLSRELRQAVENVLFLLQASARETSACCDLRDAVTACHSGVRVLLTALEQKAREVPEATVAAKHNEIISLWRRLDEWHRFTEMLVRQRMARSEIREQADRVSLYSGGAQKFLYLADKLINDFARRVRPRNPPEFATIYDAVRTVVSLPMGIVRVPTSKIFALPLVIADLWHEVGVRLFLQEYGYQIAGYAPAGERGEFLANVQDHYADIIVYLYGFKGDLDRFVTSFVNRWEEGYGDFPYASYAHTVGQFLVRLYLVYEFHVMRSAIRTGDLERLHLFYSARGAVESLIGGLRVLLEERFAASHTSIRLTGADWKLLWSNAMKVDFSRVQRALYQPLLHEDVRASVPNLHRFEYGEVVELAGDDDLNDYFAELAFPIQSAVDQNRVPSFRTTAALMKSAEIEYHRRQASGSR